MNLSTTERYEINTSQLAQIKGNSPRRPHGVQYRKVATILSGDPRAAEQAAPSGRRLRSRRIRLVGALRQGAWLSEDPLRLPSEDSTRSRRLASLAQTEENRHNRGCERAQFHKRQVQRPRWTLHRDLPRTIDRTVDSKIRYSIISDRPVWPNLPCRKVSRPTDRGSPR